MSNTILLKRSAAANAVPESGNLSLGELAINTTDARLFAKNGAGDVVDLTSIEITGDITANGKTGANTTATLANTAVVPGTYGGSSNGTTNVGVFTVDSKGRLTSASNVSISTSALSNGTSNISIANNGNVSVSVAGVENVAVFTASGANITGNLDVTANISVGGILTDNYYYANGSPLDFQQPAGSNTEIQFNSDGDFGASSNFTFDSDTNTLTVVGNIDAGTLLGNIEGDTGTFTGNVSGDTFLGNIDGGTGVFTGNVTMANLSVAGNSVIDVGNNIIGNLAEPVANTDAATKAYVDSVATSGFTIEDDTANTTQVSGNDTLVLLGTADQVTVLITNTDEITFGLPDNVVIQDTLSVTSTANVGSLESQGNITGANLSVTGNVSGDTFLGNIDGGTITATGNITGGNLSGTNISGTLTTANQPNITALGNLTSLTVAGNVTAGNLFVDGIESVGTFVVNNDATIIGNLTVQGNTITANVTSLVISDPIINLGRGANNTPLTSNDGLDRGVEMFYFTTSEQIAFMGYDNNAGKMILASNVSVSNNIVTVNSYGITEVGTLEAVVANVTGNITAGNLSGTNISGTIETAAQPNITSLGNLTIANIGTVVISTLADITSTTISTSNVTGALTVAGGVGVTGNVYADNLYKGGFTVLSANDTVDGGTY